MSVVVNNVELAHQKSNSFVDEHVDKFDAFTMSWNGAEAFHLTFGRDTVSVQTSRIETYDDKPSEIKSGRVEIHRLDVAGISMPISTAKELAQTLITMIERLEGARDV
ncbi:hypothetical protein [Pseudomonas sp. PS02290]|uniref:hypothetical protein n=1 Tax=Pseudomonas sp. PS02290 TaxID=2991430 RepID=UPI00249BCE7F|nr:hypothetical protein [Pseudomonas sp. PS02290]